MTDQFSKVKRSELELSKAFVPASSDLEAALVQCFCEALNLDYVGIDDDFFDLGGDSLAAEQLHLSAQTHDMPAFPIMKLFTLGTVRNLAEWIVSRSDADVTGDNTGDTLGL